MSAIIVVAVVAFLFVNLTNALEDRDIPRGWSFLSREYSTPISETILPYQESDSFRYAFVVAAVNTLMVSLIGVSLATVLGVIIGASQLSGNWIIGRVATVYVECFRNVPLLVQLFFWYIMLLDLPRIQDAWVLLGSVYLSNSGLSLPLPDAQGAAWVWVVCVVAAIAASFGVKGFLERREIRTGRPSYPLVSAVVLVVIVGVAAWLAVGEAPFGISVPQAEGAFWAARWRRNPVQRTDGIADRVDRLHRVFHRRNSSGRFEFGVAGSGRILPRPGSDHHVHHS